MPDTSWSLHDAEGLIRRQWRLVALTAFAAIAGTLIVLAVLPTAYVATAWLYFDPSPRSVLADEAKVLPAANESARIESAVDLIGSQRNLLAVVRELDLGAGMGGASPAIREEQAVAWLMGHLKVQRRGLGYLIAVRASADSGEGAARIANSAARNFIAMDVDDKVTGILAEQAALEARVAAAGEALERSLAAPADAAAPGYGDRQATSAARAQYQLLVERLAALRAEAYLQLPSTRIAVEASAPLYPSAPNTALLLAMAAAAGLNVGLLLALARERMGRGFIHEEDAGRTLQAPLLSVPRQKPGRSVDGEWWLSPADQLAQSPLSEFSEAVRRLRANVDQARHRLAPRTEERGSVVMVSSAMSGEGKTTLALALARSYALAGHATLLIDCDLRNPSVHKHLGLEAAGGLLEYLSGPSDPRQLRAMLNADDAGGGAQVAVGGLGARQATDGLFSGPAFARLMAAATRNFEIVILDTPPLGTVVDGLYLAPFADIVAFVIRYQTAPRAAAVQALAALAGARQAQSELVGVLNLHPGPGIARGYRASVYANA